MKKTQKKRKRTFRQHVLTAWFDKKKARAMSKVEERIKAESEARAKTEERLRAEIEARAKSEQQLKAEAEKMLLTQYRRHSVLAERIEAKAKEAIAAANAEAKKAKETVRSYAAALGQAEEKLIKTNEKAKTEARARAEAEEKLKSQSEERRRIEEQAKETIAVVKAEAEEKVRSYAAALAQAVEKLAKNNEKAKTDTRAGAEVEGILASENDKPQIVETQVVQATKTVKPIRRHIFHPKNIKRKLTFLSALVILSAIVFAVNTGNNPPVANNDVMITREDTPVVTIDVLANDTDADNDTLTVTSVNHGTNGSVTINPDSTLHYSPRENFSGSDEFCYTVSDHKGRTDTAKVNVTVDMVNDAPVITSIPVITASADTLYTYDVDAADPDLTDTLTYSLTTKPADMTINSATGLIRWNPANSLVGTNEEVVVKVADSNSVPAFYTQSFSIKINPAPPKIATLTVRDGYNHGNKQILSKEGKTKIIQSSNNSRWETNFGTYTSYDFSDVTIPADAAITSVVVYIEHFEDERFTPGKLEWAVGTGWPIQPVVWASIKAPVHEGQSHEAVDSWDVTNVADTREKINSLQLQIKNNDNFSCRKTLTDYIYVVVEWD
jgi:hypothetical protein